MSAKQRGTLAKSYAHVDKKVYVEGSFAGYALITQHA